MIMAGNFIRRTSKHTFEPMRGSREFCQRVSNFDKFFLVFLVDEGSEDPKPLSPSGSAHGVSVLIRYCETLVLSTGIVWSNGECNRQLRQFSWSSLAPGVEDMALEGKVQLETTMVHQELLATKGEPTNPINIFHRAISDINYSIIFGSR